MSSGNSPRIRAADPVKRRRAFILIGAIAVVGGGLIAAFDAYFEAIAKWVVEEPDLARTRIGLLLAAAAALTVLPLAAFAGYFWRIAARTIAHREYPPPGTALIRDVEIQTGDAAVVHARGLKVIAILLAIGGVWFLLSWWSAWQLLKR